MFAALERAEGRKGARREWNVRQMVEGKKSLLTLALWAKGKSQAEMQERFRKFEGPGQRDFPGLEGGGDSPTKPGPSGPRLTKRTSKASVASVGGSETLGSPIVEVVVE